MFTEARRAYFYRLSLVVLPLLVGWGLIEADDLPTWLAILGALFAAAPPALATLNTTTKNGDGGESVWFVLGMLSLVVIAVCVGFWAFNGGK